LSVLRLVTHDTAEFSYLRQSVRNNLAEVVAEGATKPACIPLSALKIRST